MTDGIKDQQQVTDKVSFVENTVSKIQIGLRNSLLEICIVAGLMAVSLLFKLTAGIWLTMAVLAGLLALGLSFFVDKQKIAPEAHLRNMVTALHSRVDQIEHKLH